MIAALALTQMAVPDGIDADALAKVTGACDRSAVAAAVNAQAKRHSLFLIDAYKEQRAIAVARADLAARRHALHAKLPSADSDEALRLAGDDLDDRTRALADTRALDQSEQDMIGYFRSQYLRQCSGKGL